MKATTTCTALFATFLALAIPRRVEAHGTVTQIQVGGSTHTGPKPGSTTTNKSPIRGVSDQSPVKDLQSKDMICGLGATPGTVVASAKPGDSLVYTVSLLIDSLTTILTFTFSGAMLLPLTADGFTIQAQ
jgi:hypothetical protein